ncbi:MAG TPA: Zn-dependent alcohol dehydrogenase [Acidimicrobiales bacterium]|nr:Zn-dependent alcohol dehydrogenase [Acidimicrobiales bacterium]
MKGVVWNGKIDVTEDLEARAPRHDEVRVRIAAAGVCHSDVSVIDGTIPFPTPLVMGHEGAGVVEEVGSGVTKVKPGDHVVLVTLGHCGQCDACESGYPTHCKDTFGKTSQPFTYKGEPAYMFANTSVFAEHTVVKESQAVVIDPAVPLEAASLIGCGVLTGAGAVWNRAKVGRGDTVAVFGVGGIGLNAVQAAWIAGAVRIVAVDANPAKEGIARDFGATDFVDARETDAVAAIKEILPDGVDHSFECVGHPAVLRQAIDILAWGGNCIIIGVPPPTTEASFRVAALTHIDRGILGSRYGSARPHVDVPIVVDLYRQGRFKLDELVTRTYPLEEVETVFADMADGKVARGVLVP